MANKEAALEHYRLELLHRSIGSDDRHRQTFRHSTYRTVSALGAQGVPRRPHPPVGTINSSSSRAPSTTPHLSSPIADHPRIPAIRRCLPVLCSKIVLTYRFVVEATHVKLLRAQQRQTALDPRMLRFAEGGCAAWLTKALDELGLIVPRRVVFGRRALPTPKQ